MRCLTCGYETREKLNFCNECGARLPTDEGSTRAVDEIVRAWLERGSENVGAPFSLSSQLTYIGRDPLQCQVVVNDPSVGRRHAVIRAEENGTYTIEDLASRNGTYINGEKLEGVQLLRSGDYIRLGISEKASFTFHLEYRKQTVLLEPQPALNSPLPRAGQTVASIGERSAARPDDFRTVADSESESRQRNVQLVVDKFVVRSFEIPSVGWLTIGRDPTSNSIFIDHPTISANHAKIAVEDGGDVYLYDLGAKNGTYVNGRRIQRHKLVEGDRITFGQYRARSLIFRDAPREEIDLSFASVPVKGNRLTLGRDPSCAFRLDHPVVSKQHALIEKQPDGRYLIRDLGSQNGTFVNSKRISIQQLEDNDRIRIGPFVLRFSNGQVGHQLEESAIKIDVLDVSKTTGDNLVLLDHISVSINRREFVGLIGPSGSGKSTLLDALNGLRPATSGHVYYNGVDLYTHFDTFKPIIGYVPQEDVLHSDLSVYKCLYYAAKLRLPADTAEAELRRRINDVIQIVELEERQDTLVRNLSGGQRKRVSIAIELLASPSILFLDEPTAGLDPLTEEKMMELFRRIANRGCTVLITTHLLGSFVLFDKVIVLAKGGKLAYFGSGTGFFSYFEEDMPEEVYRKLAEAESPDYWRDKYNRSEEYNRFVAQPLLKIAKQAKADAAPARAKDLRRPGLRQLFTLTSRYAELKLGDRRNLLTLLAQAPIIALLVKLLSSGANAPTTLFMTVFAALWFGCSNSVREIVDEAKIFRRERLTVLRIPSYVLSKFIVLGLMVVLQCLLFTVTLRLTGALYNHYFGATLIMILTAISGIGLGLSLSALSSSAEKALMIFPLLLIPQFLFAGLLVPLGPIEKIIPVSHQALLKDAVQAPEELESLKGVKGFTLTDSGEAVISKFTLETKPNRYITIISYPMVSRWALEGLVSLYVRDNIDLVSTTGFYQYTSYNSVYISLDSDDQRAALIKRLKQGEVERSPAEEDHFLGYAAILCGFDLLMVIIVMLLMVRRSRAAAVA